VSKIRQRCVNTAIALQVVVAQALEDDEKVIFVAASNAQCVTDFLHGLQPKPDRDPESGDPLRARSLTRFIGERLALTHADGRAQPSRTEHFVILSC